jgi:hypothetical protein
MHFDVSCFNIETYSRIHNYKRNYEICIEWSHVELI